MRDRGKTIFLCQKNDLTKPWNSSGDREIAANNYAANLLMPWSMFERNAAGKPINFEAVLELKNLFRTSYTATALRLVELGTSPAMIICHGTEGRRWYKRGPACRTSCILILTSILRRRLSICFTVGVVVPGRQKSGPINGLICGTPVTSQFQKIPFRLPTTRLLRSFGGRMRHS